ncbi:SagB family peptide dehydrogenase [Streptomyces sp. NPDC058221]|uniref:SagB family peptide dehydrogenase n=1 Tax=Streptomyces sp. NPDC058221 TaxID=3346388 RepID=UPI0036E11D6A
MNSAAQSVSPPSHLIPLWSLREDCGFRRVPGAGLVSTPYGETRLDSGGPAVERALERMTYGPVSLDNVLPGFTDGTAAAEHGTEYDAFRAVLEALQHVVVRTLALADGTHHLTVVPMASRARFTPVRPAPETVHRLSRFATLRAGDGDEGWLMESPLSAHRVLLHTPQAGLLLSCYTRPTRMRDMAELLGWPPAEAALAVGYLESAGMLVRGTPGSEGVDVTFAEDQDASLEHWSPRELLVHQRSRPGAHDEEVGGVAGSAGTHDRPAGHTGHGRAIALPRLAPGPAAERDPSLSEVLAARRSVRPDDVRPLSLAQLGELLHRSAGVGPSGRRPYPSLGSRYPLELYLVVSGGGDVLRGVYHYDPHDHVLLPLDTGPEQVDGLLAEARTHAGISQEPPVLITMTARYDRAAAAYRGTAYTALLKEVGALQQTLYLVATAMGLGPCALAFGDTETAALAFGLDWRAEPGVGEFVVSAFPAPPLGEPGGTSMEQPV